MKFKNVVIESLGYALPQECWASEFLERKLAALYERLKLPYGRLELMTGIRERRFWNAEFKPSAASALAGEDVLKKTKIERNQLDLLIHAGVCRDRLEPSTAAYVHRLLRLPSRTQIADVSNACLGFLNAMILAAGLIESNQIQSALVVSGENGRPLVEWTIKELTSQNFSRNEIKPFFANLTIGSGAVAAVLCHRSLSPQGLKLLSSTVETNSEACELCEGGSAGSLGLQMQTDAEELLEAGISLAKNTWIHFKNETQWDENSTQRFVCHQVGKQHRNRLYEALNLDLSKDFSSFEFLGNVGSVSLPITLALSLEKRPPIPAEKIALLGIGSGLSSMMIALEKV